MKKVGGDELKQDRNMEQHVLDTLANRAIVDNVWDSLTDIEAAVVIWLMDGATKDEVIAHFEFSKQRYSQIKYNIKAKLELQYEIEEGE